MAVFGIYTNVNMGESGQRLTQNSGRLNGRAMWIETNEISKNLKNSAGKYLLSGNVRLKNLKKLLKELKSFWDNNGPPLKVGVKQFVVWRLSNLKSTLRRRTDRR